MSTTIPILITSGDLERTAGICPIPLHEQVASLLLGVGGDRVLWQGDDPDAGKLLSRGRPYTGAVELHQGEPHRCHENAARLWAEDPRARQLVTGYALGDGTWSPHSWAVAGGTILETTSRCDRYFGVPLEDVEALSRFFGECATRGDRDAAAATALATRYPGILPLAAKVARGLV